MSLYNDNPVPKGPPDLCFDSSSFIRVSTFIHSWNRLQLAINVSK